MIYLIVSSGFLGDPESNNVEYTRILKIGFSNNVGKRFLDYKNHNPTCKLLKVIEGTADHEKKLHYKFRKYKYSLLREWFNYDQCIIDYFNTNPSLNDLDSLPIYKATVEVKKEISSAARFLIGSREERSRCIRDVDSIYGDYVDLDLFLDYLLENKLTKESDINSFRNKKISSYSKDQTIDLEVSKILKLIESQKTYKTRAKTLCEYKFPSKEIKDLVIKHLPDDIKSHYIALGPDRMRALSYNLTYIKDEMNVRFFNGDELKNAILKEFHVGDRVSTADAKIRIGKIYESIGYKATPKAVVLNKYFVTKQAKLNDIQSDGTVKRLVALDLVSLL